MTRLGTTLVALIGGCLAASAAHAETLVQRSFEISGVVPVVCNASLEGSTAQHGDGTLSLGTVREFCNSAQGYRMVADYVSGTDPGALIVGGHSISLTVAGETVIGGQDGPSILSEEIAYRPGRTPISGLRITVVANSI
jgi:hypothetical protein